MGFQNGFEQDPDGICGELVYERVELFGDAELHMGETGQLPRRADEQPEVQEMDES